MRFLIVAVAVFACAAAAPSGALLGYAGYASPLAYAAPLAVNGGDLQAATINAHVDASDHARAAVDAVGQLHDQLNENQGKAINAAEEHAWSSVNAAQTVAAGLDGAAAGASPIVARQLAGHGVAAYAAPAVAAYSAPAVVAYSAPAVAAYSAPAVAAYSAPAVAAYSAPLLAGYGSHSVATQSLSQTHPVPVVHAPVAYAAHGLAHGW